MKARKRGSNDEWKDIAYVQLWKGIVYVQLRDSYCLTSADQMEFQRDNLSTELKTYDQVDEEKHWRDVRERAAIAVMQAIISNSCCKIHSDSVVLIPKNAVMYADELVKQLQEKDYGSNR